MESVGPYIPVCRFLTPSHYSPGLIFYAQNNTAMPLGPLFSASGFLLYLFVKGLEWIYLEFERPFAYGIDCGKPSGQAIARV